MKGGKLLTAALAGALLGFAGCGSSGDGGAVEAPAASISGGGATALGGQAGAPMLAAATGSLPSGTTNNPLHPVVVIETSMGTITVTLDKQNAPLTVDNFLSYVDERFYDQTLFHQALKDYVVLGGAYGSDGAEKPGMRTIRNEAFTAPKNLRGTIAMARQPDVVDSATCQFFLNVSDNPMLDYKGDAPEEYGYCVFGKVTQGMEVVDRIAGVEVHDQGEFERTPVQPVVIKTIRRLQ